MSLLYSLDVLRSELRDVGCVPSEYAIFGSTALRLRKIIEREPDDVDVMVAPRVWGRLLPRAGWTWETPSAGDPPILTYPGWNEDDPDLHLFFDWRDEAVDINPKYLLDSAELVGGFVLASVEEVLRHKRAAYSKLATHPKVAKHAPDIAACEAWLKGRS